MDRLDPKSPEEKDTYAFDFSLRLSPRETLVSCTSDVTVDVGTDADFADLLSDAPFINAADMPFRSSGRNMVLTAKQNVLQSLKDGKDGCDYHVKVTAVTSRGRTISKHIILPVRRAGS